MLLFSSSSGITGIGIGIGIGIGFSYNIYLENLEKFLGVKLTKACVSGHNS
jgi:hypothetical protein